MPKPPPWFSLAKYVKPTCKKSIPQPFAWLGFLFGLCLPEQGTDIGLLERSADRTLVDSSIGKSCLVYVRERMVTSIDSTYSSQNPLSLEA
jgi:hypothetical protein